MSTTPEATKGVPRIELNPAPSLRADHNALADWARDNVHKSWATNAARDADPLKWTGKVVHTQDTDSIWLCTNPAGSGTWLRVGGGNFLPSGYESNTLGSKATPMVQAGTTSGTTSAGGVLTHTFNQAFPSACMAVILMPHQNSNFASTQLPHLVETSVTTTGFQSFWPTKGSSAVLMPYIAFGY